MIDTIEILQKQFNDLSEIYERKELLFSDLENELDVLSRQLTILEDKIAEEKYKMGVEK